MPSLKMKTFVNPNFAENRNLDLQDSKRQFETQLNFGKHLKG
jgi:hypothetical protein